MSQACAAGRRRSSSVSSRLADEMTDPRRFEDDERDCGCGCMRSSLSEMRLAPLRSIRRAKEARSPAQRGHGILDSSEGSAPFIDLPAVAAEGRLEAVAPPRFTRKLASSFG